MLEIVHAQYLRAVSHLATADPAQREWALAEARRLLGVAVAVRRGAKALTDDPSAAARAADGDMSAPIARDRNDTAVSLWIL